MSFRAGPQAAFLYNHPTYASLGAAHEKMHVYARTLLQRVVNNETISESDFDRFNNTLDRMRLEFQSLRLELADLVQNRDPLTGARNRLNLLASLREQYALVQRGVQVCAIVMLDLDHFKRVNDEYGHSIGDAVLVATVNCLQAHARPYDRIYRYGGEEFLLCMPGMTLDQARDAAERLREAIAALQIPVNKSGESIQITASFGVAVLSASRSVEDSIDRMDKAMYVAKTSGRNRVATEEDGGPAG